MTNDKWIKLNVDEGVVLLNDEEFPLDGTFVHPETKVMYSLLKTELAGLHMVAYGQTGEYRYAVSLNTPGHYCLGESFGYRVIPEDEEECPIRRALRRNGLPYGMLSHQGKPVQSKVTEGVTVPTAGRYSVITNVTPSYDLGKSYGIATYAYEDYAYLMEIKTRDNSEKTLFTWLEHIYVNQDKITDEQRDFIANKIDEIMKANKNAK